MLSNQQLGDYNGQLASARAQKADSEVRSRLIRDALKAGVPIEFSEIVNSELLRRLSEQRVTLRAQLAEQSSTLLGQHPRIKELRAQIADLEGQMRGEADRLARSLENDAKVASAKVEALSTGLDQLKRQAASTNEQDVQLRALERDAKSQRDLLESYLAKYREATARDSIGAAGPEARIISTASASNTPSWPKKLPTVLVATLGMLVLSSGFVVSGALLATLPVRPAAALELASEGPVDPVPELLALGRIMGGKGLGEKGLGGKGLGGNRSALEPSPAAGAAPLAAGQVAPRIVVGAAGRADSTLTALSLARDLARRARTVLVTLPRPRPDLPPLADPAAPGLAELVEGAASFGTIITRDPGSRLHLITSGRAPLEAATILASPQLAVALEALARSYDHVVVDVGTVGEISLAPLAAFTPNAVLAVDDLDASAIEVAREHLAQAGFADTKVLQGDRRRREDAKAAA
jgi:succinoglycan biosynthesis transport protein ExoP